MTEEEGGKDWHDALAELFGEDQLEAPETGALEGGLGTTLTLPKRRSRDETGQRGAEASAAEPATKEPKAVRERRRRGELKSKCVERATHLAGNLTLSRQVREGAECACAGLTSWRPC